MMNSSLHDNKTNHKCNPRQGKRKRQTPRCLLLSIVFIFQLTLECQGRDDRRRPPPPPPPPRAGSSPRGVDWRQQQQQQQEDDAYAYPSGEIGLNQKFSKSGDDIRNSRFDGWSPKESSSYQQNDPYGASTEDGAFSGLYDYGASASRPYSQQDPYSHYDNEQMFSDSVTGYADPSAAAADDYLPRTPVPQNPIHYEFPVSQDATKDRENKKNQRQEDDLLPASASARRDLVTRYWATKIGKAQIMMSSTLIGVALGNFLGKSLVGSTNAWMIATALFFWISSLLRTALGELVRAMGLSLLLVSQRSRRIRRTYPTWRYIPAAIGVGSKRGLRPFPPARNPWRYTPRSPRDPDFNMMFVLVSMAFVGSMVGGNLPVIPTWMGALAGAASFAFACTWQSPRGDLARSCGMRVVSAVGELWEIQADLAIIPKATMVSSQIIDKAMILDRKHRVKDRFLSLANKGYEQASKLATQIHEQQRGGSAARGDGDYDERDVRRRQQSADGKDGRAFDTPKKRGRSFDDQTSIRRSSGNEDDNFRGDRRERLPTRHRPNRHADGDGAFYDQDDDFYRDRDSRNETDSSPRRSGFWKR
ncbi:hypothetical protein IV203_018367 [Nitzschia inconspicua]|uniref:Uncharacterized protein n=1 Tax=Nitzschia inconspicua TaxID=303405 RepID=A0A9K3Q8M0_9STRA|nr:hypothetical protein IV203_018367 [Nitzschia inconspicua]